MRATGSPLYLTERGPRSNAVSRHFAAEEEIVRATMAMTNPQSVRETTKRLATARHVRIAGFRNGYFASDYARALLSQVRPDVALLIRPGQTLAEGVAELGPEDVALVVGVRRRIARFTDIVRAIADTGCDVILIADNSIRETPRFVRWTLTCAVETPQPMDSYAGLLALLRLLAVETAAELGPAARRSLERIERAHEIMGELE
jgi:DNA-binding MurR/RpiR family transcriptional regulator